jgi:[protein-PII] uridylyltransferase
VQEPHVKNGCGGLRDYQNLIWMTYARHRTLNPKDLVGGGLISKSGWKEVEQAYDFILRVRSEMHYTEKRAEDLLTLRLQGPVATNLGYRHKKLLRRIEALMHDYYTATRDILQRSSEVMDRFHLQALETGAKRAGSWASWPAAEVEEAAGALRRLHPQARARVCGGRRRVQRRPGTAHAPVSAHAEAPSAPQPGFVPARAGKLPPRGHQLPLQQGQPRDFRGHSLEQRRCRAHLRQMHRVGFLGRYMPEFGALTNLVQHEFFHLYTADEHTLRTLDKLDELSDPTLKGAELFQQLFHDLQQPYVLYLALLLHDAGRAANKKTHSDESTMLAAAVCRRLQIKGERRRLLLFLVDNHLLMYRTATTKSLEDPQVIEEFAAIVRTKENLDTLLLMTYADSKGTSDKSWSGYKEASIRQLYHSTLRFMNAPADFMRKCRCRWTICKAEVKRRLGAAFEAEVEAHFRHMPPRISISARPRPSPRTSASSASSLSLIREEAAAGLLPVMTGRTTLTKATASSPSSAGTAICSSPAFPALSPPKASTFSAPTSTSAPTTSCWTPSASATRTSPPSPSKSARHRVEESVRTAFGGSQFDFSSAIAQKLGKSITMLDEIGDEIPQRIYLNNNLSPDQTVLELQLVDRLGLLYDIFMAIGKLGFSVTHARISTGKGRRHRRHLCAGRKRPQTDGPSPFGRAGGCRACGRACAAAPCGGVIVPDRSLDHLSKPVSVSHSTRRWGQREAAVGLASGL